MTKQDLLWGMKIGVGAGLTFALLAWLSGGASGTDSAGVPLQPAVFAFLLDGPIAGLVLGGLRPLTRSPWGSAVLGLLIGAPFYVLAYTFSSTLPRSSFDWLVSVVIPLLFVGGGGGAMVWFMISRSVKARERRSQEDHHHQGHEQKGHQRRR